MVFNTCSPPLHPPCLRGGPPPPPRRTPPPRNGGGGSAPQTPHTPYTPHTPHTPRFYFLPGRPWVDRILPEPLAPCVVFKGEAGRGFIVQLLSALCSVVCGRIAEGCLLVVLAGLVWIVLSWQLVSALVVVVVVVMVLPRDFLVVGSCPSSELCAGPPAVTPPATSDC